MARRIDERRVLEWRERFERYLRAGLSVARFCERERVSVAAYYHWRKRLSGSSAKKSAPSPGTFASVRLVGVAHLAVCLPGGTRLEIPLHDPQALELTLRTLARLDDKRVQADSADVTSAGGRSC